MQPIRLSLARYTATMNSNFDTREALILSGLADLELF